MKQLHPMEILGIVFGAVAIVFGSVCTWIAGLFNDDRWYIGTLASVLLVFGIVCLWWPITDDEQTGSDDGVDLIPKAADRQEWNDFVEAHPFVDALNRRPLADLDLKPKPHARAVDREMAEQDAAWKRTQDGAGDPE